MPFTSRAVARYALALGVVFLVSCGAPKASAPPSQAKESESTPSSRKADSIGDRVDRAYIAGAAKLFAKQGKRLASEEYADFFKEARLDPDREEKLREILAEYRSKMLALGFKGLLKEVKEGTDCVSVGGAEDIEQELNRRAGEVLSKEEMARFESYRDPKAFSSRTEMALYTKAFPRLTQEKAQMVMNVFGEEMEKVKDSMLTPALKAEDWQAVEERICVRLSSGLSPEELSSVKKHLDQMGSILVPDPAGARTTQ